MSDHDRSPHKHESSRKRDRSSERDKERHTDRDKDFDRDRHRHRHSSSHRHDSEKSHGRHSSHRHHRDRGKDRGDGEGERHRRRKHHGDRDDENHKRRKHGDEDRLKSASPNNHDTESLAGEEANASKNLLKRDSWMEAPSAMDIEYTQRGIKPTEKARTLLSSTGPQDFRISARELNPDLRAAADGAEVKKPEKDDKGREVDYTFGDESSQWRMVKLKAVYTQAEENKLPVDEVARERYGDLRLFDDAREEQIELDRRKMYGKSYTIKEKPTGTLYAERKALEAKTSRPTEEQVQGQVVDRERIAPNVVALDNTALNRLKAQLMKAQLRNSPDAAKLEAEYNAAVEVSQSVESGILVLGAQESRMLAGTRGEVKSIDTKRGRERGLVEENEDMTIEDMVREERRTRNQHGGQGMRDAERIAKDAKFDTDLDYMDDNASKLAKQVAKSTINLKNTAVADYKRMNSILASCPLCAHEDTGKPPLAPTLSLATRTYLTLPTLPELASFGAVIVPLAHHDNLLHCDDDEWEEIRNFQKSLMRFYDSMSRGVIFYENAVRPYQHRHAAMFAVPIPYRVSQTAPAFFKEGILSYTSNWSDHKPIVDTMNKGKLGFRNSLPKAMPYFHVWFGLDGGTGHIVEDDKKWPKGDLFAREILAGMIGVDVEVWRKQGRWTGEERDRVKSFREKWSKWDWTSVLTG